MTATTSTVPQVKAALVTLLTNALAPVQVAYAWPGADTADESVFLGHHPSLTADILGIQTTIASPIATIKAGRQQRQQDYPIPVTLWSFRPDLRSDGAAEAEAGGFVLLAGLEDVLANAPALGLTTIQRAELNVVSQIGGGPIPFESGWASVLVAEVDIYSRLT